MIIEKVVGYELLDSRGRPTVGCRLMANGKNYFSIVPSGASTGSKEALELRDNDSRRFKGLGVLKAVENINSVIHPNISGRSWDSQQEFDKFLQDLDGSKRKNTLGANAILAVSLAFSKAFADLNDKDLWESFDEFEPSLPIPLVNVINGGVHADNLLDFQEFMLVPVGFSSFREAIRATVETVMELKNLLKRKGLSVNVGDEGGFAPNISDPYEALDFLVDAIQNSGYEPGKHFYLALDVAASEFYSDKHYRFKKKDSTPFSYEHLIKLYSNLIDKYPLISIEDPFSEFDEEGWKVFYSEFSSRIKIIGDDLLCTNLSYISNAFHKKQINGVLIKPNQIGTVTETLDAIRFSKQNGLIVAVSHRSGDTEDTFIADLAVGIGAEFIKTGSVCRSERTAKYNRLILIEYENQLQYQGLKYSCV